MQRLVLGSLMLISFINLAANAHNCTLKSGDNNCALPVQLLSTLNRNSGYSNTTFDQCADICLNRTSPPCVDLIWSSEKKICYPQYQDQGSAFRLNGKFSWWARECWRCPSNCPKATNTNLLLNPGFETGKLFPWFLPDNPKYPEHAQIISPGHNSTYAVSFETFQDFQVAPGFYQNVNLCPDSWYKLTYDVKLVSEGDSPPTNPQQISAVYASGGSLETRDVFHTSDRPPLNQWYTGSMFFHTSDSLPLSMVELGGTANNSVQFDNLYVRALPKPLAPKPGAVSLLQNGGFETGSIKPWLIYNGLGKGQAATIISPGIDSQYAVNITLSDDGAGLYPHRSMQPLNWTMGTNYLFSLDIIPTKEVTVQLSVAYFATYFYALPGRKTHIEFPFTIGNLNNTVIQSGLNETSIGVSTYEIGPGVFAVVDNIRIIELMEED